MNSQDLVAGDVLLGFDGSLLPVQSVECITVTDQVVCNLTVKDFHTFAVSELEILVHNESWCDILEKKFGWVKPQVLIDLVKNGAVNGKGTKMLMKDIHGHHIVMRTDPHAQASRDILDKYGIDVFRTEDALKNADPGELHNMSFAMNAGYKDIHSKKYADAVQKRLEEAVNKGGTDADIRQRIIYELAEMRKVLEKGESFW